MERKEFLKRLGLGSLVLPLLTACHGDDDPASSGTCPVSPSETAGPFPTKSPATLNLLDIRSDRTGVVLSIEITIQNKNNNCSPLEGALVDIWHCDKEGEYSEYGGTGMQVTNYTAVHFLRGRQPTNSDGIAAFTSIFPGWYPGRAPHIHVHIYNSSGTSLLVTQIAFPTSICNTVYNTATNFYQNGTQDTSNTSDNVFSDSIDHELATVTGNITDGYSLTHTIVVNA